ncbi:acetyl/propionyl/methylcrotonyl-CoA carboxylase subunit alpha [Ideonella sp. A 288]|uniref:acetyl/propionyl/methylcrotonyl-CoA carboxylase subunit alpha n=1 Tax=Ideonella sp. A 288 TaxID=1962181 RepID=UPI000B4AA042|nr:acetyl/propionyl/methylcrotonyl-CoA carboxylase subunit alpha [Ideonella sp. A 288]
MTAHTSTPFHKILIANRGEIALRIQRTAHRLGYRTVAVYSTADAQARHVLEADQAVCIGEPAPRDSYLAIDKVIAAARLSGADAVHPGYGFLAENEDFAAACRDAGLVFIGPSPEAIRAMGDKAGAKALMIAAGVPCIPGWQGEDQRDETLALEAAAIGWPLMIKATAGGGGRGMRLVTRAEDFADALRSARSEALGAFGDGTVLLERAIVEPRHIEIQVFADRHGHAIHLGERDCSVQRRHQKLVEEAPSPAVTPDLRARMGEVAVAAVRAIRYEGAGTLEFLLDREGRFYFMEMNTRLQVEHPVTEAITGLDLVEWQLRVAAGEPLPLAQDEVRFHGHAIEVRLCAEDAARGFMPQSGRMHRWEMPAALRVEHALRPGDEVPPHYDSMIAKLVAHGPTRDEACRRLRRGLHEAVALGVTTNQGFLADVLAHPAFAAGQATTAFIDQHADTLLAAPSADQRRRAAAVAAWLLQAGEGGASAGLPPRWPVGLRFELDGQAVQVPIVAQGEGRWGLDWDGRSHALALQAVDPERGWARVALDGLAETVRWHRDGARLCLRFDGRTWSVDDLSHRAALRADEGPGDGKLRATMNGRVVAVLAALGDTVQAGQPLVTLEAMKMEHVHAAPCAGVITALSVAVGDQVATRRVLLEVGGA